MTKPGFITLADFYLRVHTSRILVSGLRLLRHDMKGERSIYQIRSWPIAMSLTWSPKAAAKCLRFISCPKTPRQRRFGFSWRCSRMPLIRRQVPRRSLWRLCCPSTTLGWTSCFYIGLNRAHPSCKPDRRSILNSRRNGERGHSVLQKNHYVLFKGNTLLVAQWWLQPPTDLSVPIAVRLLSAGVATNNILVVTLGKQRTMKSGLWCGYFHTDISSNE